jgi:hypothetical protein
MNKAFTFLAAAAWAGVAISSATPAEAIALTSMTGSYATCTMSYSAVSMESCGYHLNYNMIMRFLSTACGTSGGTCAADYGGAYTEWLYPTGRKMTTYVQTCPSGQTAYGIDSCAC